MDVDSVFFFFKNIFFLFPYAPKREALCIIKPISAWIFGGSTAGEESSFLQLRRKRSPEMLDLNFLFKFQAFSTVIEGVAGSS